MIQILIRIYRSMLRSYPRPYLAQFGAEMEAVFAQAATESESGRAILRLFLRELRDLPGALINAYQATLLAGGDTAMINKFISPSTRRQAFIGSLPFLVYGISTMFSEVDSSSPLNNYYAPLVTYALALVGLLVGWIRGFPLWSYGYLGWSLVLAWSWTNIGIYGRHWERQIWIPFGIVVLAALLWTRSLNPIKKFFMDIWNDWSRLLLTSFALGAWVLLIYDENHHPWLMLFILGSTLAVSAGPWFFLRSVSLKGRVLSIIGCFFGVIIVNKVIEMIAKACGVTWDFRAYYGLPESTQTWYQSIGFSLLLYSFWILVLFLPGLIGALHGITRKLQTR